MSLTTEQLELRRAGISGSDAAPIVGMSSRYTPADVWLMKKHPEALKPPSEKQARKFKVAHRVERSIAEQYMEERRITVEKMATVCHPTQKWLLATPDYVSSSEKLGLEIKNVSEWQKEDWGAEGTDLVPQDALIQSQHYMMVLGFERWDVACLIGGHDFRIYHVYADKELQAMLYNAEKKFYTDFILGDKEPQLDGGEQVRRYVLSKYPQHAEKVIQIDPYTQADIKRAIKTLCGVRRLLKQYKVQEEDQKTILMNFMQDAAEMRWEEESILVRWKTPRASMKVDWKTIAEKIIETALQKNIITPEEVSALKAAHTAPKKNTRKFTVIDKSDSGEEEEEDFE